MSVRVTPYPRGGWEVDVRVVLPDGSRRRDRKKAPVTSRSAACRWGQARERELLKPSVAPSPRPKEVPTLADFAERFLDGYARANRQKPSGIAAKETILRLHLIPLLGDKSLDTITNEDVQRLKLRLGAKAPKTVNNVLTTLHRLFSVALEWGVIEGLPCTIRQVKMSRPVMSFHDFDAFEQLVAAARAVDANTYLIVLLGGEAGLRCGEMMALEWADVDLRRHQLRISRSEWRGHVTATKGGQTRYVRMTGRLTAALRTHRHLRGPRVLMERGRSLSQKMIRNRVRRAAGQAGLAQGGVHILRHTFCSHLSMCNAPVAAIQALAGHADLATTQRYMHLNPAALKDAIGLLEREDPDLAGEK